MPGKILVFAKCFEFDVHPNATFPFPNILGTKLYPNPSVMIIAPNVLMLCAILKIFPNVAP